MCVAYHAADSCGIRPARGQEKNGMIVAICCGRGTTSLLTPDAAPNLRPRNGYANVALI